MDSCSGIGAIVAIAIEQSLSEPEATRLLPIFVVVEMYVGILARYLYRQASSMIVPATTGYGAKAAGGLWLKMLTLHTASQSH